MPWPRTRERALPEHAPALEVRDDGLRRPEVAFLPAWRGDEPCGCGALKEPDANAQQVKSMRTRPQFLRTGFARAVPDRTVRVAGERGGARLFPETGTGVAFEAAHAPYRRHGFARCGACGGYAASDLDVFIVMRLGATRTAAAPGHAAR